MDCGLGTCVWIIVGIMTFNTPGTIMHDKYDIPTYSSKLLTGERNAWSKKSDCDKVASSMHLPEDDNYPAVVFTCEPMRRVK